MDDTPGGLPGEGRVAALDALAHRRRLTALSALEDANSPMTTNELATEVAIRELDYPDDDLDDSHVDRVLVALHHVHLPKLEEANLVRYDPADDTVERTETAPDVETLLHAVFDG
jgi:citrate lyase beta subunit